VSIHSLNDQLSLIQLGNFQAYLWRDPDGVTLVDSGADGTTRELLESLGELGMRPGDLDRVVLTHFHDDHAGGAALLAEHGVQIVAHAGDAPIIEGAAVRPEPNFTPEERELHAVVAAGLEQAPAVGVDVVVTDGDELPIGQGAVVIGIPGHTDGSIGLFLPNERVLFTGDTAAEYQGEAVVGVFNLDRRATQASFRRLAENDAEIVCFGHGRPLTVNGQARLTEALSRLGA
jgi:glyoxylase-like metal-dependent hydrolase (beta-lactamase superfamily II)